ncbi:BnaC06g10460D [Brassica napus]|uniref:BnaC06g10460D protein n=1 Tax=Brassica napus TaxID=3708 RepID=A0A078GZM1_BRANA|nr:BnaC06g10460D [Brassica napus]
MDTGQAGKETLTRSSLQPDPNRSPDRRFEKNIQSFSINSTIFDLSA